MHQASASSKHKGKRLVFVTNNSTKSRKQYGKKFETLGLNVSEEEIFASSFAEVAYLKSINFPKDKKAVYEHHPRPKQLIGENDIPQKLQNFIEYSRDGQRAEFWWPSFGEADGHFFDFINTVL